MVAYLTKSDASEGFNPVIDFLNGSYINYALTVNPDIYMSCIKQFWNTIVIKQDNDITREMILLLIEKFQLSLKNHPYHLPLHLLHYHNHLNIFHQHPRLKRVGTSQRVDSSEDTVMDDASNQGRIIDELDKDDAVALMVDKEEDKNDEEAMVVEDDQEDKPVEVHEVVDVVTTAKLITELVTAASETVTAASTPISAAEPKVPAAIIIAAPVRVVASTRRRKGVVIRDPEEELTTSSIIPADTKSKDKGKGIMVEEPKPLKKKQQVEMDEEYARKLHAELNKDIDWDVAIEHVKQKAKEDPTMQRYQVMKKRPQTEAQARKNMIMYLKNVAGFRLDYFKEMSYDDIRLVFEAKFNSNIEFLLKTKEQIEEEENRVIQSILLTTLGAIFEKPDRQALLSLLNSLDRCKLRINDDLGAITTNARRLHYVLLETCTHTHLFCVS
nr:hypothetical protein [Tanacetum cinerariifolium]